MLSIGATLTIIGILMMIMSNTNNTQKQEKPQQKPIQMATYENCIVAFQEVFADFLPTEKNDGHWLSISQLPDSSVVIDEHVDNTVVGRWPLPSPDRSLVLAKDRMQRLRRGFIQEARYTVAEQARKALSDTAYTEFHERIKKLNTQ